MNPFSAANRKKTFNFSGVGVIFLLLALYCFFLFKGLSAPPTTPPIAKVECFTTNYQLYPCPPKPLTDFLTFTFTNNGSLAQHFPPPETHLLVNILRQCFSFGAVKCTLEKFRTIKFVQNPPEIDQYSLTLGPLVIGLDEAEKIVSVESKFGTHFNYLDLIKLFFWTKDICITNTTVYHE